MEVCVVFIPCFQVFRCRKLRKETLEILAEWEHKRTTSTSSVSQSTLVSRRSLPEKNTSLRSSASLRRGEMYTMTALEKALQTNSTPLLLFAALRDFSGE